MRSDAIAIVGVGFQGAAQMHLAQDNDVVHTFTPDRSDQPFGKAILPRRGWCGRLVPNVHGAQSARDDAAIDPVAIADEVARGFIPRKRLRDLTCNPFRRRICCDVARRRPTFSSAGSVHHSRAIGRARHRPSRRGIAPFQRNPFACFKLSCLSLIGAAQGGNEDV
jgi:hypothetical protein